MVVFLAPQSVLQYGGRVVLLSATAHQSDQLKYLIVLKQLSQITALVAMNYDNY